MLSDYDSCPRIHLGLGRGDRHVAAEDESAPRSEVTVSKPKGARGGLLGPFGGGKHDSDAY